MAQINYRHYEPGDEAAIVALWNESLHHDPITPLRFRNMVLLDANFDPAGLRLAFEGERLVGAVYSLRRLLPMHETELEPDNGWITFFFVAKDKRRGGIGTRLMRDAFEFLTGQGRKHVFFSSYAPNYFVPGVDADSYPEGYELLQKLGFNRLYSPVAMDYSLVGYSVPEDIRALKREREGEGYTFRLAQDSDLVEVIRFATDAFNPDWGRAIREGVLRGLSLGAIHVARENGKLVGFCMHGGYEGILERFGPFGVDPSQQGKGLGKILLHDCLANMRAQGLHGAWFLWTGETTTAGHLYKKLGFEISRRFHVCKKSF
ncbi:GNAT family N-acetyltransferase [Paenibacillus hemerocallicola]|uniref:GNAT family N-acetyltransferase n=1 Tax=Paenibacillus hemerocallicola TaxID=1172614 RepID=A0A5C4T8I3_9BACL|nr:GNAT family N-acetyltransferase [Paenibacillus hemerocallicola]TNJ65106.1 GNAT family N-acetyltransferase [Paenibacillus hemerocallicola]